MSKRVGVFASLTIAFACSSGPAQGVEGGACFSNGTCNAGLSCVSNVCTKSDSGIVPDSGVDAADGGGDGGPPACTDPTSGSAAKFAANTITLPTQKTELAFDLDGDGKLDNQLGGFLGGLIAEGFDPQTAEATAVTSGQAVLLIEETSDDPTGQSDACAGARWSTANATASAPKFDGTDTFTIATGTTSGQLVGTIASGELDSSNPAFSTTYVQATLRLVVFPAGPPLNLPLVGAEIELKRTGTTISGRIHGAIRESDVQQTVIPGVAADLNAVIAASPNATTSKQLLQLFDNGGVANSACAGTCKSLDGNCAFAGDGIISDCEVATSAVIKNLLAPDVQLFDSQQNWHPTPGGTAKDSLSVGIGFTGVGASF